MTPLDDIKKVSILSKVKHPIGYGVAIILIALFLRAWHNEAIGRVKAEGEQKVIAARDEVQKEYSAKLEEQIRGLKTPEQAKPLIEQGLKSGGGQNFAFKPLLTVPRSQLGAKVSSQLSDAPTAKPDSPVGILTPDQMIAQGKRELSCEKVEREMSTCQKDKESMQQEINDLNGGSKWHKVVQEAKCLGFLGGGAALGAKIGGWKGAAIGGVSGEVGCKIFF